ncbi:ABC transporter substrate-binding protein [Vibrio penaeicida]|uniref:ABC transporter substrate-binding protein n=1 Tax=Vibrio penaeicida TaxID=104609 RepID=UPI001F2AEC3F|nr:ABC transporter substrate-binding protein [Vibrio penaeicida]
MKKFALAVLVGVAFLAYFFVGQKDDTKTLAISGPFEFSSQDLSKDGFLFTRLQVVEPLIGINQKSEVVPVLAESWVQSEDRLTWSFNIRNNITFHDGTALTVDAVVFSLKRALYKPGVLKRAPIESIAANGNQVVITLTKPFVPMLSVLAHFSTSIAAPSSYDESGEVVHLYGTGPYQVGELVPPHKALVKIFDGYWGNKPNIQQVSYLAGHRSESRALLAQSGQADLVYTLDPLSLESLNASDNLNMHVISMPRTVLIKLNNEHPFLNHADIRKAVSLVIDRKGIADHVLRLPGSEAYQLFSPALGVWHLGDYGVTARNVELAKQLLTSQGWTLNAEQKLEKDGKVFEINLTTYADRPELPLIATAIQAQLAEVGITLDITIDSSSAIPSKHHDGTLEMALIARNYGILADPLTLLLNDFATHKGSDWGPTNWSSKEFTNLLGELSQQSDVVEYRKMIPEASKLLADQMPLIPISYYQQIIAVNKRVENFTFDPFELNYRVAEMELND